MEDGLTEKKGVEKMTIIILGAKVTEDFHKQGVRADWTLEAWSYRSLAPAFSQERQTALLMDLASLKVDTKRRGMHFGFTGEETLITQSFQCHLAPHPCVLGEGIGVQSTDLQLWPEDQTCFNLVFLVFVHWKSELQPVVSSLLDLNALC